MRSWDKAIPKSDLEVHAAARYGTPHMGMGCPFSRFREVSVMRSSLDAIIASS